MWLDTLSRLEREGPQLNLLLMHHLTRSEVQTLLKRKAVQNLKHKKINIKVPHIDRRRPKVTFQLLFFLPGEWNAKPPRSIGPKWREWIQRYGVW